MRPSCFIPLVGTFHQRRSLVPPTGKLVVGLLGLSNRDETAPVTAKKSLNVSRQICLGGLGVDLAYRM
jgi:hypothetical protein